MSVELKNDDYVEIIKTQAEVIRRQQKQIDSLIFQNDKLVEQFRRMADGQYDKINSINDKFDFFYKFLSQYYNPKSDRFEFEVCK